MTGFPVVVMGGAGHIGAGVVEVLREDGWGVVTADALEPSGEVLEVEHHIVDATDESQMLAFAHRVTGTHGGVAGLVNCAGLLRQGTVSDLPLSDWDAVMDVNVKSVFLAIRVFAEALTRSAPATVVNISSVSAFVASVGGSAYSASKGAVMSLTSSLAGEFAARGVRVVSVCPGWVDGGFTNQVLSQSDDPNGVLRGAEQSHLLGALVTSRDVGNAVSFLLSEKARMITGSHLFVDAGFHVKR